MNPMLPPVPQTGRRPVMLTPDQERRLLSESHPADAKDPFATDIELQVRHLGRLALRREVNDPSDYLALGDLCAQLALNGDRLQVIYLGKALMAYQKAGQIMRRALERSPLSPDPALSDETLAAERAMRALITWALSVARITSTARNIAAALWAVTWIEQPDPAQRELIIVLTRRYVAATLGESAYNNAARETADMTAVNVDANLVFESADESAPRVDDTSPDLNETHSDNVISSDRYSPQPTPFTPESVGEMPPASSDSARILLQLEAWLNDQLEQMRETGQDTGPDTDQNTSGETAPGAATIDPADPTVPAPRPPDEQTTLLPGGRSDVRGPSSSDAGRYRPLRQPVRGPFQPSGASSPSTGDFEKGDYLGERYEVRGVLRGGMGVIYLCYDHEGRQSVAIKTFQARFVDNRRIEQRFTQEAYTWIRLEKHRNIVQARKVETFGDERVHRRPHIILEYIAGPEGLGPDLKSWIDHNRLELPMVLDVCMGICLGMQHAVRMVPGLVHRDLKPANILVRHDGLAKVTDFGLVRSLDNALTTQEMQTLLAVPGVHSTESAPARLTQAGNVVGTVPYMSPEQCIAANEVDLRSDLYAFGAILYEMLVGRRLFNARSVPEWIDAHLHRMPDFPDELAGRVPAELRALTLRCLAKNPDERPGTWEKLRDELAAIYERVLGLPPDYDVSGDEMEQRELMDNAYSLTELGFGKEALIVYDRVLELEPDSAWVWARKGRTLRVLGHFEDAVDCFDHALALDRGFVWAWWNKGLALSFLHRYAEASEAYETALRLRPNDVWILYNAGRLLFNMGQHREALERLDRALANDPRHALSLSRRGDVLLSMKQPDAARQSYERAVTIDDDLGLAWYGLGLALRQLRRGSESIMAFMRAQRLMPNDVRPRLRLADALVDLGRHTDALPVVKQVTILRPDYKGAWVRLGVILHELRRDDEALAVYDKALALKGDHAPALYGKAEALRALRRLDEAARMYRAALAAAPDKTHYQYRLADTLIAMRRYHEAQDALNKLIERGANSKGVWATLGLVRLSRGDATEALAAYRKAAALDDGYAGAWNGQAQALTRLGRYDEAVECAERAIELAPRNVWYRLNMLDPLLALGQRREALDVCDDALRIVREMGAPSAPIWVRKGQVLRRMNQHDEARLAYDEALSQQPENATAWYGKGRACAELGARAEALACFRRASALRSGSQWFAYSEGELLVEMGQYEAAIDALNRALAIDPTNRKALLKRDEARRKLNEGN